MQVTNYAYDSKFESIVINMGINRGMFAFNDSGYINPMIRDLYNQYKNDTLNVDCPYTQRMIKQYCK